MSGEPEPYVVLHDSCGKHVIVHASYQEYYENGWDALIPEAFISTPEEHDVEVTEIMREDCEAEELVFDPSLVDDSAYEVRSLEDVYANGDYVVHNEFRYPHTRRDGSRLYPSMGRKVQRC